MLQILQHDPQMRDVSVCLPLVELGGWAKGLRRVHAALAAESTGLLFGAYTSGIVLRRY